MSSEPQDIHNEYLSRLRRERAEVKQSYDALAARLRKLDAAIGVLEGLDEEPTTPSAPGIVVGMDQFKGQKTPKALAQIMLSHPHRYRSRELAEALIRSGQAKEMTKALQNTKFYLSRWRNDDLADYQDSDMTWGLTVKGKAALSAPTSQRQPSEQSLFASRK